MIYSCTNEKCLWFGEGDTMPDACPRCGQAVKKRREEELTGDEWCHLGLYWTEAEPADDEKALACFRRSASLGSGWGTCNLGLCMEQGIGIQPDLRQAV